MNIRDLEYLLAVAELKHFRKAAEQCHVSQPTLSGQLKKLENYLGVQLFERSNRKVLLTLAGEEIAARAQRILNEVEGIERYAHSRNKPMSIPIRLGLIPTLAPYLLPLITQNIHARFPDMRVFLNEAQTDVLIGQLRSGKLDLLILAVPVEGTEDLVSVPLFEEPFLLAVPEKHPLANRDVVRHQDLRQEEVLLLEDGHCLRGQALDICFNAGARENTDYRATSLETLRHMVAAGAGITLVPKLATRQEDPAQMVRYIEFKQPQPTRTVGMMFRRTTNLESGFKALGEMICTLLKEQGFSASLQWLHE